MDSDGVKVMFTDFNMSEAYGSIGFASAIGCSLHILTATQDEIKLTVTVTADLATASVYTPGKPNPTSVTGAESWSRVDEAVTLILPSGAHTVTLSYTTQQTPPEEDPGIDTSELTDLIQDNLLTIIPAIAILWFLNQPRGRQRRIIKQARGKLRR